MEHVTIKDMGNGMVKLTPDEGYMLVDSRTQRTYSEAVVKEKDVRNFSVVQIENKEKDVDVTE